jgi:hypothetical protein
MNGLYIKLSRKTSYFVELRKEWCGFGVETYEQDHEVFLGHLQITVSQDDRTVVKRRLGKKVLLAAVLSALALPSDDFARAAEFSPAQHCPHEATLCGPTD